MRVTRYFDHIASLVEQVKATDLPAIEEAAKLVADTIMGGGIVQAFGSGHSRAAAMEISAMPPRDRSLLSAQKSSRAVPPHSATPRSIISDASSGGVFSSVERMVSII